MQQKVLGDYQTPGSKRLYRCYECGERIVDYPSQRPCDHVFCDNDCHNAYQTGPELDPRTGPHKCSECGAGFDTELGLSVHYGREHKKGVDLTCSNCGDEFNRPPSQSWIECCSPECSYELGRGGLGVERIRRILGDRCWRDIAADVREDAGGVCEMCGDEIGYGKGKLQTHHLLPLRAGGTHADWNLTAVCPTCHGKAEAFAYSHFENCVVEAAGAFGTFHHLDD